METVMLLGVGVAFGNATVVKNVSILYVFHLVSFSSIGILGVLGDLGDLGLLGLIRYHGYLVTVRYYCYRTFLI